MSTRKSNIHRRHQKKRKKTRKNMSFKSLKCSPQRKDKLNPYNIGWTAARVMIIPDGRYENPGPGNDKSIRFGFLIGRRFGYRWGFETGYFHDFRGGFDPNNKDYPHSDNKWPTQFSKGTGLSMQLFLYLGLTKKK